ncbi:hypothetical protein CHH92_06025 [Bacillus sonorensis]|uniref:Uncharacterized protein n=1 Tax=Bacillus sonorensis L12 TaxID=1274524 RepID=M5P1C2_9BACI|nr:hypothetical protein [Bacillus sonorensis]EME73228.1 hypothetical protein BSONL12_15929 [Bacillus sonorensis L12]TWK79506.1 hypothetical protein CHCC20335_0283 [Bacillus paralicheniformis]MBG9914223.1 hypothetical protein [Bacillus sonorensis]PAD61129.1 hypothetical protein CHH92_06025 [Bacillus sonorensis]RHJ12158.1 hypothetical protein DW143_07670 [Bacillus sonorensis]
MEQLKNNKVSNGRGDPIHCFLVAPQSQPINSGKWRPHKIFVCSCRQADIALFCAGSYERILLIYQFVHKYADEFHIGSNQILTENTIIKISRGRTNEE